MEKYIIGITMKKQHRNNLKNKTVHLFLYQYSLNYLRTYA